VPQDSRPFRFYDNRQKYLAFVNTCDEKWVIAERCGRELDRIHPTPPAFRLFDAGMGDGTLLAHLLRAMHRRHPTVPFFVVGKEISLEDIRLALEKVPDRLVEHPATVVVLTNLYYAEAPWLSPARADRKADVNWIEVALEGSTAHGFGEQLRSRDEDLVDGWQVRASPTTGNPLYARPTVLTIYRKDQQFLLDDVIPRRGQVGRGDYDLVIIAQPWRARMEAGFKVDKVLLPLVRSLAPGGRAIAFQSAGNDPGLELVQKIWPDEDPFRVDRHTLVRELLKRLGDDRHEYDVTVDEDASLLRYRMHTLPEEIGESIGTSTLFAAWNAAIYVAQIEDERLEPVVSTGKYLGATAEILKKHKGLWFNDETFTVSRRRR